MGTECVFSVPVQAILRRRLKPVFGQNGQERPRTRPERRKNGEKRPERARTGTRPHSPPFWITQSGDCPVQNPFSCHFSPILCRSYPVFYPFCTPFLPRSKPFLYCAHIKLQCELAIGPRRPITSLRSDARLTLQTKNCAPRLLAHQISMPTHAHKMRSTNGKRK